MAQRKQKRKRKSGKRIRAGRKTYNKGLRKYMTSPKYAAKRRAAAKKAARTRLRHKRGRKRGHRHHRRGRRR